MEAKTRPDTNTPWYLSTSCPVLIPEHEALTLPRSEFDAFIQRELEKKRAAAEPKAEKGDPMHFDRTARDAVDETNPFMAGLRLYEPGEEPSRQQTPEGMMRTENNDLAHAKTHPLVDLMAELEDTVSISRLTVLLNEAWAEDPLITLKLIFNARSIHLGKSSRQTFYKCAGWLAANHPLTLVANLRWLSRPTIEKKQKKEAEEGGAEDAVLVDMEKDSDDDPARFDVKHGVAHGYWKDLLNILVLAAAGQLMDPEDNDYDILQSQNRGFSQGKRTAEYSTLLRQEKRAQRKQAKTSELIKTASPGLQTPQRQTPNDRRKKKRLARNEAANNAFSSDAIYRALHLTIARLFAEQLTADLEALRAINANVNEKVKGSSDNSSVSLCGKWAPTHDRFHDRHTFVLSSIAEIMYPRSLLNDSLPVDCSREVYLRHARERYRRDVSALRQHLDVVERKLTAGACSAIDYSKVPSIAMNNYSRLFYVKDEKRFVDYLTRVAEGSVKISGATLLPSTLVRQVWPCVDHFSEDQNLAAQEGNCTSGVHAAALVEQKKRQVMASVADGQWNTLVQRIKDSGTLSSSIAVCDVSGSMSSPTFKDGTCPMHSAIGLSLLVAEVTAPPFGGAFIDFSLTPHVQNVDLSQTFTTKVRSLRSSYWGFDTNFVSVFEDCILPVAVRNAVAPEDMVKRVFVFSDMHFNDADPGCSSESAWQTSYGRIKAKFAEAGYEVPELIFWNLAGGRGGDGPAPKPVTLADVNTTMVSGYSQGMLKVFLDNGGFDDEDDIVEEDEVVITKDEDGDVTETVVKKKKVADPLRTVKKAIGHEAYDMLEVYD
ncbi:hypothetical protein N3K66_000267 [Trichothecium roseum]|uniref:Uncharacterized protein n=1 Tax=Trichothecium roseum TaxID=47278 RepID=A0ACC0VD91_9HYPO|nr:hypothetical protein N3K66_000267 [Trichothecium roseum]